MILNLSVEILQTYLHTYTRTFKLHSYHEKTVSKHQDPLEEGMATHTSILAWRISWTEEPGEFQSMGSQRVRHD